jgi:beta-lactamase regulating signal transducer with metallopeptidase domain
VKALFLQILSLCLSASIVALLVMGLRLLLKKAPRSLICALWALVALRLLIPVFPESKLSVLPEKVGSGQIVTEISERTAEDTRIVREDEPLFAELILSEPELTVQGEAGEQYVVVSQESLAKPKTLGDTLVPLLAYLWAAGAGGMLLYMLWSYLRLKARLRSAAREAEDLYSCDGLETPFILGLIRPRIYLPSEMDPEERPFVLAHERAHLRRGDHFWKPFGFFLLSLYWFNPLFWLAYVLLCRDIEAACDEKVICEKNPAYRKSYSEALVHYSVTQSRISACPLAFGEQNVKRRIRSVLNYRRPAFWLIAAAVCVSLIAAGCALTNAPGRQTEPDAPAESETLPTETLPEESQPAQSQPEDRESQPAQSGSAAEATLSPAGESRVAEASRQAQESEARAQAEAYQASLQESLAEYIRRYVVQSHDYVAAYPINIKTLPIRTSFNYSLSAGCRMSIYYGAPFMVRNEDDMLTQKEVLEWNKYFLLHPEMTALLAWEFSESDRVDESFPGVSLSGSGLQILEGCTVAWDQNRRILHWSLETEDASDRIEGVVWLEKKDGQWQIIGNHFLKGSWTAPRLYLCVIRGDTEAAKTAAEAIALETENSRNPRAVYMAGPALAGEDENGLLLKIRQAELTVMPNGLYGPDLKAADGWTQALMQTVLVQKGIMYIDQSVQSWRGSVSYIIFYMSEEAALALFGSEEALRNAP